MAKSILVCRVIFTVFVFGFLCIPSEAQIIPIGQCNKNDSCSCVYDDGTIVNLRPLSGRNGVPGFSNVSDSRHDLYTWNPCEPFTFNGTDCTNVAVCMLREGIPKQLIYDIGDQDSAQFMVDANGTLKLTYTADKGDYKRVAEITLQCMKKSKFDFFVAVGEQQEENDTVIYKFTLASHWACALAPNIGPPAAVVSDGLSGGAIFGIVFGSLIGAYLVFGIIIQAMNGKRGLRLLPNYEFWCNVPNLCKGGKGKEPLASKGANYDAL
ncbi:hypothetical protein ACF0H5_018446 [Mactra antiquata]